MSFAPGATVHIIVPGETLWGLADITYNNPWLWPQLWNENRYITDSHWIYPGDIVKLRSGADAGPADNRDGVHEGSPGFLGAGGIGGQRRAAPDFRGVLRRRHRPSPARDDGHAHERNPNAEERGRQAPSAW